MASNAAIHPDPADTIACLNFLLLLRTSPHANIPNILVFVESLSVNIYPSSSITIPESFKKEVDGSLPIA